MTGSFLTEPPVSAQVQALYRWASDPPSPAASRRWRRLPCGGSLGTRDTPSRARIKNVPG